MNTANDTHEGSFRNLVGRPSSLLMGMKKKIYPEIGNDAIWTVRFENKLTPNDPKMTSYRKMSPRNISYTV